MAAAETIESPAAPASASSSGSTSGSDSYYNILATGVAQDLIINSKVAAMQSQIAEIYAIVSTSGDGSGDLDSLEEIAAAL